MRPVKLRYGVPVVLAALLLVDGSGAGGRPPGAAAASENVGDRPKATALPAELQGVWTIVSGEEDGRVMRFARGDTVNIGETELNEVIVQGGRLILNDNWGQALVFRAEVVASESVKRLRVWGDRAETRKAGPLQLIYRPSGDTLTVCLGPNGHPPTTFAAPKGSGHMLLVLKRAD